MAEEDSIKDRAFSSSTAQALITLRNILARNRYEEIEEIPLLPTPIQVICMLILNNVRRTQKAYELVNVDDNLPVHPVYARYFLITHRHASLLWYLFSLRRPMPLKRFKNWIEEKELELMLEGGILRIEGQFLRSRYLVTSTSGLFFFTAFLRRTDTGYVFTAGGRCLYAEELQEQAESISFEEIPGKISEALKNPRMALYQLLQYLHRKRQKKKRAREEQLYRRALRQLEERNYERAEYNFNRVLTLNGGHQMARCDLIRLMRELGRQEEAEELLREMQMVGGYPALPLPQGPKSP
ncbi:MAG: hypothetical protein AB2L14_10340 [Candidatus Xenobiia bacterium LiM19]